MEARPSLRFRKLRITWSVMWGFACVLIIASWVRSYYVNDVVWNVNKNSVVTTIGSTFWHGVPISRKPGLCVYNSCIERWRICHRYDCPKIWMGVRVKQAGEAGFDIQMGIKRYHINDLHTVLAIRSSDRRCRSDTLAPVAIFPPHSANCHDASGRSVGVGRGCGAMAIASCAVEWRPC